MKIIASNIQVVTSPDFNPLTAAGCQTALASAALSVPLNAEIIDQQIVIYLDQSFPNTTRAILYLFYNKV